MFRPIRRPSWPPRSTRGGHALGPGFNGRANRATGAGYADSEHDNCQISRGGLGNPAPPWTCRRSPLQSPISYRRASSPHCSVRITTKTAAVGGRCHADGAQTPTGPPRRRIALSAFFVNCTMAPDFRRFGNEYGEPSAFGRSVHSDREAPPTFFLFVIVVHSNPGSRPSIFCRTT